MKVDVVILTKNSARLLEECLTSVYKEIPICHLIVVDGFSTDETLEIVGRFERNYGNTKTIKTEARHGNDNHKRDVSFMWNRLDTITERLEPTSDLGNMAGWEGWVYGTIGCCHKSQDDYREMRPM